MITITDKVLEAGYGAAGGLIENESFSPEELEYPLLLESSNDAAEAFAAAVGYSTYIQLMNALAQQKIGLKNTRFFDPSGMSPGNVSNARDLFKLAQYLYPNEQGLLEITGLPKMNIATTSAHQSHEFTNIDPFVYDPHFIGGKTGRTDQAKEAMLSLFTYSSKGKIYPVGVIVLRSEFSARETDSETLFSRLMTKLDSLHE
jgi:D-alanyl-D-alanine endopeptidase (penicillin-binding protein 7)